MMSLALDDLHHADPASLRLLLFLLRQLRRARILIVGAFRPEPGDSPEAALLLNELTHEASARCVTLSGLSRHEIARYVELVTGLTAPASVSELLRAQTAGNPLFLQHLIESWRTRQDAQES